ncbi:2-amino-4-hydroxy-6-hydroxymethyldihydropteridine diphosphokinase [Rhodoferax sp.]|uniref:2-amino-4-hydroxy-6- hydroxymethyldihydropteridine diphosphokinase n=1 Tax=Rhodoferax sp. TaxID=50421 RepID=UPI0025F97585|nr:2-amino-4-hydroxy-6-hydroxymethyldihydropteridine diphosphokinase [Rhodoferax sp.]
MVREPVEAFIGLGANLGEPMAALRQALARLAELPYTELLAASGLYGSTPVDSSGPDYVNAVAWVRTRLTAPALLEALQHQEASAGRERPYRNAPRTLDLDLLLYGSARMEGPTLTVPHPRMTERAFVLLPLAEIAPHRVSDAELASVQGQGIWRLAG